MPPVHDEDGLRDWGKKSSVPEIDVEENAVYTAEPDEEPTRRWLSEMLLVLSTDVPAVVEGNSTSSKAHPPPLVDVLLVEGPLQSSVSSFGSNNCCGM